MWSLRRFVCFIFFMFWCFMLCCRPVVLYLLVSCTCRRFAIGWQHVFNNAVVRFQIRRQWVSHVISRVFEWAWLIWPLQRALISGTFVVSILLRCLLHVCSLCVRGSPCHFWIQSSVAALLLIVLVAQGFADNFFLSPDVVVVVVFFFFFLFLLLLFFLLLFFLFLFLLLLLRMCFFFFFFSSYSS